jgi:hypothetical protein
MGLYLEEFLHRPSCSHLQNHTAAGYQAPEKSLASSYSDVRALFLVPPSAFILKSDPKR